MNANTPSEADVAREILEEMLRLMDFDASVEVEESPDQITLTLVGDQPMGLLIGKGGQTLNAIELIVRTIAQTKLHDLKQHVVIDAEGYRARHADRLVEMAKQAAEQVLASGEPVPLEPMNPRDRRIVHMAIADIEGVASVSSGLDAYRHVIVCLPGQCEEG